MTRRTKNPETPEQTVDRWMAGMTAVSPKRAAEIRDSWEAGMACHVTAYGLNYERYELDEGGYVVIEWDDSGNIVLCSK